MFIEGSTKLEKLGIGKFGPAWIVTMLALFVVFANGLYAYWQQLSQGLVVTNMRTIGLGGASWGLYVSFDVIFVGVSFAGIVISAMIRLFGISYLKPIARMAELMTIIVLSVGAVVIIADLGRPVYGLINFPRYARVMSPFFGTFTLVIVGYLFSSLVFFYLSARADAAYLATRTTFAPMRWFYLLWALGFKPRHEDFRRHANTSFWLSIFILPLLVTAHSTLGLIFGLQSARPGWYTALQAPGFVVMAGISGTGVIMVIAASIRKFHHLEDIITKQAFKWLGVFMMILCFIYTYFIIVEEFTAHYAAPEIEGRVAHQVTEGVYAPMFWLTVACLMVPALIIFFQFVRGKQSVALHVVAGLMVQVAAVLKRLLITVPSQTHGTLLPYRSGWYAPSWIEISIILGLASMMFMLYLFFMKIFPIVPLNMVEHDEPEGLIKLKESHASHLRRLSLFGLTLAIGLTLVVVGFLGSARFGTGSYLDPVVPFSPMFFIAGVMLCFISAIVYEAVPQINASQKDGD